MTLIDKNTRASVEAALNKMNVKYDPEDIKKIKRTKEGNIDMTEVIKNSNIEMTDEIQKKMAEVLSESLQVAHTNVCTTRIGTDGNLTISTGEHLNDISQAIDDISDDPKIKSNLHSIHSEGKSHWMSSLTTNPANVFDVFSMVDNEEAVCGLSLIHI